MPHLPSSISPGESGHIADHEAVHALLDDIDDEGFEVTGFLEDTLVNRPAAAAINEGWLFYATDEPNLYRSDGTNWIQVVRVPPSTLSGLGAAGTTGVLRRITDGGTPGNIVEDNGSNWRSLFSRATKVIVVTDPEFGAVGDGVTDDTAALQSAIDAAVKGTMIHVPQGLYRITSTLTMSTDGVTMRSFSGGMRNTSGKTEITFDGSAGDTMLEITGQEIVLDGLLWDGEGVAAICIDYIPNNSECQLRNSVLRGATGTNLVMGDGTTPNLVRFEAWNVAVVVNDGATGIHVNAQSTEDIVFNHITVTGSGGSGTPGFLIRVSNGQTTWRDVILDQAAGTGFCVKVEKGAGWMSMYNFTVEGDQFINHDGGAAAAGSVFMQGDLNGMDCSVDDHCINFQGSMGEEDSPFVFMGVRIRTSSTATNAPNVRVQNATLIAQVIFTDSSGGTPGPGTFDVTAGGAHIFNLSNTGPHLQDQNLELNDGSAITATVSGTERRMMDWTSDILRLGEGAGWVGLIMDIGSGVYRHLIAGSDQFSIDSSPANDETNVRLVADRGGTESFSRVKVGAADSGGTGFRALVVDN